MSEIKEHKTVKNKKYLTWILLLILLFLAFLIGRSYQESLSLNSTQHAPPVSAAPKIVHVTWAPYTDNAHNFSLEYPSTWTVDMTASNAQFVLRKKDEKGTYIYFSYSPTNVSFTKQPNASVRETLLVGKKPLVFTDYFTGLGEQTAAYADLRTALLGGSIYTIVINLDVNDTAGDTITVKKILASLKPLK